MSNTDKIYIPIAIVLFSCAAWLVTSTLDDLVLEKGKQKAVNNPQELFTYGKDCTMFRFYDENKYHYFSNCQSQINDQPFK